MPQLRLALAQVNPTVGDLDGNARLVREWAARAADAGAHLVAFPEMVLTGYPVEDLALRASFVDASREGLRALAADLQRDGLGDLPVVVGYLDRLAGPGGRPQNAAAVLAGGRVRATYAKHHLPNYGVFDEYRVFAPGNDLTVVRVHGVDVALAICEDLWQDGGPVAATREVGAGLLLALNASPFERAKDDTRLAMVARRARGAGCALAYVNLVGGQDDLVFDGDSVVVDAEGRPLARAARFTEDLLVVDLDLPGPATPGDPADPAADEVNELGTGDTGVGGAGVIGTVHRVVLGNDPVPAYPAAPPSLAAPMEDVAQVYAALVSGLGDYVRKNGFRSVALGLSGGIDSALVAAVAADALGGEAVVGVSMPSVYSSEHSKDDAADLAQRLGVDYRVQSIAPMVAAFQEQMSLVGVAEENLQARCRAVVLMALSNSEGHLVLATGNKSELSVGYSTVYGDSVGGYAPLKDVPKTLVFALSRWRNEQAEREGQRPPIPENTIVKPPSAELRPDQVDEDSLPPYDVLDPLLEAYVEGALGRAELVASGFAADVVDRVVGLVDRAEWKRRQFAPGPKVSRVAFGRDRRLPLTSRWREADSGDPSTIEDTEESRG